ncbi:MAG: hypothetical protein HZB43_01440 [candidate division Zixibacteria bacterium]|nr:hypothetical protein [candidate division Zixibacteria bacterium]
MRLATFFDMSPAEFLKSFTQDRFDENEDDEWRRELIENPDSSVITFLRRRSKSAASPCIFLKYILDSDETPRRVCGVHSARPLACREYYYDTCKKRVTGELAASQAEGYELIRDSKITANIVNEELKRLGRVGPHDSLSRVWRAAYWSEMLRALDPDRANNEGADSYTISEYQDPLDEKLNRLLSARNLRFEEKYGSEPNAEQLQSYEAGLSFKRTAEYERIMRIIHEQPRMGLFEGVNYPHRFGLRSLMPGVHLARDFGTSLAGDVSNHSTGSSEVDRAIRRGWEYLLGVSSLSLRTGGPLELEPPGAFELLMIQSLAPFGDDIQRAVAGSVCLKPARHHLGRIASAALWGAFESLDHGRGTKRDMMQLVLLLCSIRPGFYPRVFTNALQALRKATSSHVRAALTTSKRICTSRNLHEGHNRRSLPDRSDILGRIRMANWVQRSELSDRFLDVLLNMLEHASLDEIGRLEALATTESLLETRRLRIGATRRLRELVIRWSGEMGNPELWDRELLLCWPRLCAKLRLATNEIIGVSTAREYILISQALDGGWNTDLAPIPPSQNGQSDYLENAVRSTTRALESLWALRAALI